MVGAVWQLGQLGRLGWVGKVFGAAVAHRPLYSRLYPDEVSSDYAFMPFGAGPRRCLGDVFATLEGTVALAMVLRRFDFAFAAPTARARREGRRLGAAVAEVLLPKLIAANKHWCSGEGVMDHRSTQAQIPAAHYTRLLAAARWS